jgi:ATP-dependent Clp protease, protease subunit
MKKRAASRPTQGFPTPVGKTVQEGPYLEGVPEPAAFLVPTVIEKTGRGERVYDIYSRLLKDRIVFIGPEINDYSANLIVAQILFLMSENKNQDINIYINSPGGIVTSGLAIYDTMQFVPCDMATYCIGQASSMAAVLLAAGTKGKRHALPHSRIMIHQPWGGASGTADDIVIQAAEIKRNKQQLLDALQRHTGQSRETLEKDTDRDFFMTPQEAKAYGIVDEVLQSLKEKR